MSFVDKHLMPGERIVYRTRLHRIVGVVPTILCGIGLLAIIFAFHPGLWALGILGVLFIVIGLAVGLDALIRFKTSEFVVSDRRVLIKVGLVRRRSLELLLTKVEGIGVDQGLFGRICNYGTIIVTGTGGTKESFETIRDPFEFRRQVQMNVSNTQGGTPQGGQV